MMKVFLLSLSLSFISCQVLGNEPESQFPDYAPTGAEVCPEPTGVASESSTRTKGKGSTTSTSDDTTSGGSGQGTEVK